MGPMTNRLTLALMAPTVAAVAALLVACGGGGGTSAASEKEKMQEYALKQAECMRRHGVDVPDPKPNGGLTITADKANADQVDRAMRACEREIGKPPAPPQMSAQDEREFRDKALRHAQCMRDHGVDFPDPTFGANGRVTLKLGSGLDPRSAAFQAAEKACGKLLGK